MDMSYVVGFLFSTAYKQVALIRKNKPTWQAGKLNGIGGKIEPGEKPKDAMIREFQEEAGPRITAWEQFCRLHGVQDPRDPSNGGKWEVFFFVATVEDNLHDLVRTCTDEQVEVWKIGGLHDWDVMPNLNWLIPMALYMDWDRAAGFVIEETYD